MRKKVIGIIAVVILIVVLYFIYPAVKKMANPQKVHYHAGFVVFKDDQKIDFSDFKYMRVKPCTEDKDHEDSDEDIQAEKAHLHDNVGEARFRDLFINLKYSIDYSNSTAYINGKKVENFENLNIQPDDSLVVLIGNNKTNHLQDAVKKEYIEERASKSVDCD